VFRRRTTELLGLAKLAPFQKRHKNVGKNLGEEILENLRIISKIYQSGFYERRFRTETKGLKGLKLLF
jgi:hypothetical protein